MRNQVLWSRYQLEVLMWFIHAPLSNEQRTILSDLIKQQKEVFWPNTKPTPFAERVIPVATKVSVAMPPYQLFITCSKSHTQYKIKNFATVDKTYPEEWKWESEQDEAFQTLKAMLFSAPILRTIFEIIEVRRYVKTYAIAGVIQVFH